MNYINESELITKATRLMERDGGAVKGTVSPLRNYRIDTKQRTNDNGVNWYENVYCPKYPHHLFYVGEIWLKCKEIGREQGADWWNVYGITIDGDLILFSS